MAARACLGFAFLLAGCFPSGAGVDPPSDRTVYFPVGLALDPDARHLYIANSDFDLQYNAGTLENWDLDALRARLPVSCTTDADCNGEICDVASAPAHNPVPSGWCVANVGTADAPQAGTPCPYSRELSAPERQLYPGRCASINPQSTSGGAPIHLNSVRIGAFATDLIYRARPTPDAAGHTGRLFVPVRGDATLHWIDVTSVEDDGSPSPRLDCGQDEPGTDGACAADHRRGNDPGAENTRGLTMLPEPFGIDANDSGEWVMVTNQASFATGIFQNLWGSGNGFDNGPSYQYTVAGLPGEPMGVVSVPRSRAAVALGQPDLPEFLVSLRGSAELELLRVYPDAASNPPRPYAKAPDSTVILTNANGTDSRGMALDASERAAQESACATRNGVSDECANSKTNCPADDDPAYAAYVTCVQNAAAAPLGVYVTNREPASLLVGQTREVIADLAAYDVPTFQTSVPLDLGPARVVTGDITNTAGEREPRAFALSFDSRRVLIYDIARTQIEGEIITGRGPQAIAIDGAHALAYVAHFIDSYIGVVDLDQRHTATYGAMIAMIERPAAPRASK
ncbi:MAG TPA: hypothetical protein VMI54_20295 [Polyangiaceae bacterium]|nr:hypothetical protein [Polyangiaceae bacterium]